MACKILTSNSQTEGV